MHLISTLCGIANKIGYTKSEWYMLLKRNDKMFKVSSTISNVVPASQRPKKGMKPIVEIAFGVEVFLNSKMLW